jgi:hypothetical protein
MRTRLMVIAVAVATGLIVTTALAQHEEHHEDQAAPPPGKTDTGKPSGMTSGKMLSQTMTGQSETGKLVDQLMKSFAAIQTENDPTALQEKLAEHGLLLKQLQTSVKIHSHMVEMMQDMMNRGTMGREDKSGEHKN